MAVCSTPLQSAIFIPNNAIQRNIDLMLKAGYVTLLIALALIALPLYSAADINSDQHDQKRVEVTSFVLQDFKGHPQHGITSKAIQQIIRAKKEGPNFSKFSLKDRRKYSSSMLHCTIVLVRRSVIGIALFIIIYK